MKTLSENGLSFIKKHEGYKLYWYQLNDGGLTCGYGHYVSHERAKKYGIKKGDKITIEQAEKYLKEDIKKFVDGVNSKLKQYNIVVNQNQFDALVSYSFNRGLGGLNQLISNSKDINSISKNIVIYWGSNVNYKNALINRREKEKQLFDTKIENRKHYVVVGGFEKEKAIEFSNEMKEKGYYNYIEWK